MQILHFYVKNVVSNLKKTNKQFTDLYQNCSPATASALVALAAKANLSNSLAALM